MNAVSPVLPMLVAALLLPTLPANGRRLACVAAPLASLYLAFVLPEGAWWSLSFLGYEVELLRCDRLSRIFALTFALAAVVANLYGWYRERCGEQIAALLYASGAMAVVYAGDLLSMLVAWEIMAVASAVLVFKGQSAAAIAAGQRYLLMHLAAGGVMLLGVAGVLADDGAIGFGRLASGGWATYAILAALCVNAAVPPLHAWLSDAYPEASVSGSVFLSAFTTKAAVYCLARGFAGEELLIWAGAGMALYGVVFATMEDDMRRLLSYHIVSQVGYMVCGIGIGSALALNGAVAHAVCNLLYKTLLFMAVGAVIYRTGRRRLSELGGIRATMPLTLLLYMVGGLAISGLPLLNGFVSKSLVLSGAADAHLAGVVLLLNLASVGTFLSVGLKLPFFAWWNAAEHAVDGDEAPPSMLVAMAILALLCVVTGVYPRALYDLLPLQPVSYDPFTEYHVFEVLLAMAFCGIVFWQALVRLTPHAGRTLDFDEIYRRPSRWLATGASVRLDGVANWLGNCIGAWRTAVVSWAKDPTSFGDDEQKGWYDENAKRPPVGALLTLILATLVALAAVMFAARA